MTGKPLGAKLRADQQQRLEAYRAARDEGLDTWQVRDRIGIGDRMRERYERWYRRQAGLPDREQRIPGQVPMSAVDKEWREF